jgi:hypothetical protein
MCEQVRGLFDTILYICSGFIGIKDSNSLKLSLRNFSMNR